MRLNCKFKSFLRVITPPSRPLNGSFIPFFLKPKLNTKSTVYINHKTFPDLPVFLGARMSMNIPIVFSPVVYKGDRNVAPLDFNEAAYQDTKKLTIGYFMTDDWMDPCATVWQ